MDFTTTDALYKKIKRKVKCTEDSRERRALTLLIMDYLFDIQQVDIVADYPIKPPTTEQKENIEEITSRLNNQEPIQYVLGETEFYELPFFVSPEVLIPRPETEELVHHIISQHKNESPTILDIGTGSGCIAISLAKNIDNSKVFALDISMDALSVTQDNAKENGVNIQLVHDDILKLNDADQLPQFDIIVSNPPYITESEKDFMEDNVLAHEPHLALFVDNDKALIFYDAITAFAKQKLKNGGHLYVEINEQFGKETAEILNLNGFTNVTIHTDLSNKERYISGVLG